MYVSRLEETDTSKERSPRYSLYTKGGLISCYIYIRELLLISILLVKLIVTIITTLVAVSTVSSRSIYSNLNLFLLLYTCLLRSLALVLV